MPPIKWWAAIWSPVMAANWCWWKWSPAKAAAALLRGWRNKRSRRISGLVRDAVFEIPSIGFCQAFLEGSLRRPAHMGQLGDIHHFAWRAVGLAGVEGK